MCRIVYILVITSYTFVMGASVQASAWLKESGTGLSISSTEHFRSDTFRQTSSSVYFEYGVSGRHTIGGKIAVSQQEYGGRFPAGAAGISELDLFWQSEIRRTDHSVWSSRLSVSAPTELSRTAQLPNVQYRALTYGNAVQASLLYGRSLDQNGTLFASAEIGFKNSLGPDADQIVTELILGKKLTDRWMLMAKANGLASMGNESETGADYEVLRVEPSITYRRHTGNSYSLGLRADLAGRSIETGSAIVFSHWREF